MGSPSFAQISWESRDLIDVELGDDASRQGKYTAAVARAFPLPAVEHYEVARLAGLTSLRRRACHLDWLRPASIVRLVGKTYRWLG